MDERVAQAVRNNAVWCDAMCRAHGRPGEFRPAIWTNRHPVPPFYSNAVTLTRDGHANQLAAIRELLEAGIPGSWSVKDSFSTPNLDLAPLGFEVLFEATWIYRSAARRPAASIPGVRWARLTEVAELATWELAWRGDSANTVDDGQPRIFLPPLLQDETIAVVAAYEDGRIVAGAIGNITDDVTADAVVGVSNIFLLAHSGLGYRAGCIAAVMEAFPGRPLVGYEWADDLAAMQELGFEALGPLRVWVR